MRLKNLVGLQGSHAQMSAARHYRTARTSHLAMGPSPSDSNMAGDRNEAEQPDGFRYDPAEMQSLGAKEIRLFVSRDRGASWQQRTGGTRLLRRCSFTAGGSSTGSAGGNSPGQPQPKEQHSPLAGVLRCCC